MKRMLDYDPFSGIETWHEYDAAEKKTRIYYVPTKDEQTTLDFCKYLANEDGYSQKGIKEDWWHYAHIPNSLMLKWHIEEGVPLFDAEEYNKRANRREYKGLKLTAKSDGSGERQIYLP